jgi:CheY-like chemotaxis protein
MKKVNCILLIDDNPADNYYHTFIITHTGAAGQIKVVKSGHEALTYLNKANEPENAETFPKPNLIFLDINMPRMNGFEFMNEYDKLDENLRSEIILIMLTTSMNPDDRHKAQNFSEIREFIHKPLTRELFLEIVDKYFK